MSFRRVMSALGTRVAQSLEEANRRDPGIQYQRNAMAEAQARVWQQREYNHWLRHGAVGSTPPGATPDPCLGQTVSH